jgi:hypothetical protein
MGLAAHGPVSGAPHRLPKSHWLLKERTTSSSGQLSGLSSSGDTGVTVRIGPSGRLGAIKQASVFASKLPNDLTGSTAAS